MLEETDSALTLVNMDVQTHAHIAPNRSPADLGSLACGCG